MDLAAAKGTIDFGIITIREDECAAILERFPYEVADVEGRKFYSVRRISEGDPYNVAVVCCVDQGNQEALAAASAMLEELEPRWLLVVGIAGAAPAFERSLGDVVVSTK